MKTLISWLARNNDFIYEEGTFRGIDKKGPNFNMHRLFYDYNRHIILFSGTSGDRSGAELLKKEIDTDFPDHRIELVNMNIKDVIDLNEIKPKIESRLLEIKEDDIDIFISPGTPTMQVAWYFVHIQLGLNTRLIQMRPADKTESGKPEIVVIDIEQTSTPITSVFKEQTLEKRGLKEDYLITKSIESVYDKALKIAKTDRVTVMIQGETGTGKEHLARFIHEHSIRQDQPYTAINCSAFHDQLLESRLFGYKKGTFTGADKDTKGLFEESNRGTIFLDEIGDISPYMQQSLLRVIEAKEIQPVGGKSKKVDVRIISATSKDLAKMCRDGKFRWDLYYRLNVTELELPELKNRGPEEIKEYIDFFLLRKQKELKKEKIISLGKETLQFLLNYPWPGNVRELENLIETLYVYYSDIVELKDLPVRFKEIPENVSLQWKDVEKKHIEKVLKLKKGNKRQAWMALGYKAYNTFASRLEEYGIEANMF